MKFLVDAQLPKSFCAWLREAGHEVKHTLELPRWGTARLIRQSLTLQSLSIASS